MGSYRLSCLGQVLASWLLSDIPDSEFLIYILKDCSILGQYQWHGDGPLNTRRHGDSILICRCLVCFGDRSSARPCAPFDLQLVPNSTYLAGSGLGLTSTYSAGQGDSICTGAVGFDGGLGCAGAGCGRNRKSRERSEKERDTYVLVWPLVYFVLLEQLHRALRRCTTRSSLFPHVSNIPRCSATRDRAR